VLAILDTDIMARNLRASFSTSLTSFKLGFLLKELECPHQSSDLHNSGNDATFTLHAMLMLVVKSSESREMSLVQRELLKRLRVVAHTELYECQRWKPTRRSLGFYAPGSLMDREQEVEEECYL
jgi:hypothetical protein